MPLKRTDSRRDDGSTRMTSLHIIRHELWNWRDTLTRIGTGPLHRESRRVFMVIAAKAICDVLMFLLCAAISLPL